MTELAVSRARASHVEVGEATVLDIAEHVTGTPWRAHDMVMVTDRLPPDGAGDSLPGTVSAQPGGGLNDALMPQVQRRAGVWVGAPLDTCTGAEPARPRVMAFDTVAVPLSPMETAEYDAGMSNATLWPVYHGAVTRPQFRRPWWNAYVAVNRRFAQAARRHAAPEATVWVQGFRLHLVPGMLRRMRPDLAIAFTSRLPFPPYELFSQLPWRHQLLEGLAGADLLGLPRPTDVENLLRAANRCGLKAAFASLSGSAERGSPASRGWTPPHATRTSVFPTCVDARGLDAAARDPRVATRAAQLRAELGSPRTVLLGVDSLDATRGILHRLNALEAALGSGRLAASDTTYVQIAVPARHAAGNGLREQVESAVARINGTYARIGRPIVHYLHRDIPPGERISLYLAADTLLATPLSDGTGMTAMEYVACRHDERGALVLSEFTGTSDELPEALIVNPHDQNALQDAIVRATALPVEDMGRRMRAMRRTLLAHDAEKTVTDFLGELTDARRSRRPAGRPAEGRTGTVDGRPAGPT